MGRMADARKRAKKADPGGPPPDAPHEDTRAVAEAAPDVPPERAPSDEVAETDMVFPADEMVFPAEEAPVEPAPPTWVAQEMTLPVPIVAPAEPPPPPAAEPPRSGRLVLPASGLASDILALAESADLAAPRELAPLVRGDLPEPEARAHNISFFAAPQRDLAKAVEATEHLATFFLADEEYGVDVRVVQEIIRVADITQVPRAPDFIKGVINLRGRIIPVVDLKRKLGLGDVDVSRQARIVVVKLRDRLIGLLVDGASQVLKVPVASIEAAPEEVVEIDASAIRGVAKLKDRLIILMDLQKILMPEVRDGHPS